MIGGGGEAECAECSSRTTPGPKSVTDCMLQKLKKHKLNKINKTKRKPFREINKREIKYLFGLLVLCRQERETYTQII